MCPPMLAALPAITSVLSTGLGVMGAVMQHNSQKQAYNDNKTGAERTAVSELEALQRQELTEQDAAAQDKLLMQREAVASIADAKNRSSFSGTAGLSVNGLINSIRLQEAERQQAASTNLENQIRSIQSEKRASGENYVARVKSVQKPSGMSLALGIGNAVVGGIGSYYQNKSAMG